MIIKIDTDSSEKIKNIILITHSKYSNKFNDRFTDKIIKKYNKEISDGVLELYYIQHNNLFNFFKKLLFNNGYMKSIYLTVYRETGIKTNNGIEEWIFQIDIVRPYHSKLLMILSSQGSDVTTHGCNDDFINVLLKRIERG